MARAFKVTEKVKELERYSDFTTDLELHPISEQLLKLTNEAAIASSMKNLILTNKFERFYRPELGSRVQAGLFEPFDEKTVEIFRTTITTTIENFEPRAKLTDLIIKDDPDNNAVHIRVIYSINNIPEVFTFDLILNRVR